MKMRVGLENLGGKPPKSVMHRSSTLRIYYEGRGIIIPKNAVEIPRSSEYFDWVYVENKALGKNGHEKDFPVFYNKGGKILNEEGLQEYIQENGFQKYRI
jgi:hypothetical protein